MASAPASGEDSLIARYFKPIATDPGAFNLDDDAAALKVDGDDIVVTTDAIVEGVHYLPGEEPERIGRTVGVLMAPRWRTGACAPSTGGHRAQKASGHRPPPIRCGRDICSGCSSRRAASSRR